MDEEKVNFGSYENLNVIVQNDIEPVDVEMVKFDVPLTRTAGSVPIRLIRKGNSECPVTCSCEVAVEGQVVKVAMLSFAPGEVESSFDLVLDQLARYTDISDYKLTITDIKSELSRFTEPKEYIIPVENDVERSHVKVTALNDSVAQSSGKVDLKVERFGNLSGQILANYQIEGGQLDGFKGLVQMEDGEKEKVFTVNLDDNPQDGDSSKVKVKLTDVDGASCPKIEGGDFEFEVLHDVKPTKLELLRVVPEVQVKQSDGSFDLKMVRSVNMKGCVTIPYHVESNLPGSRQEKGVVILDEGESEANITVPLDMAPNKFPDVDYSVVIGQPRGVKDVVVEEKVYSVEVEQDLRTPSITFVTETLQATQSDIAMPVKLFRRDNTHGSVMVKYAMESTTAGRIEKWEKLPDGVAELDLPIEFPREPCDYEEEVYTIELLEVEGESLPEIGDLAKVEINVKNDIKPTVITLPVTSYELKQTDVSCKISVVRLPPNLDGNLEIGWHVENLDGTGNMIDYFYERQRGVVKMADGDQENSFTFHLIQVPQKLPSNRLKIILEHPKGGVKPQVLNSEVVLDIINDIPRPLIQLDIDEDKIKQTAGGVTLPVSRSRFLGGKILVPWYLDISNENSPYYGVGGREMIDDGEEKTEIKFKLPNFPLWAESNKLILRLGGLGGDHFPEQAENKGTTKDGFQIDFRSG